MKRTALVIGMMVIGFAMVSAQGFGGQGLGAQPPGGPGFGGQGPFGAGPVEQEEVELTGRLQLAEDELPVLLAGGQEYTLLIPPTLAAEIEVSNNQQVSVEGLSVERPSFDLLGNDTFVHVRVIEIGNDRYILPENQAGRMARGGEMGPRGGAQGMMGPRSNDGGYGPRSDDGDAGQPGWGRR